MIPSTFDLEERITALEAALDGKLPLDKLPLKPLQDRMLADWDPSAGELLLKGSITNSLLGTDSVDERVLAALVSGTYTPTWTGSGGNPAIGNGTLTGSYIRIGKLVKVDIQVIAGATTTFGAGSYNLTLPFAPASRRQMLDCDVLDTGVQHYLGAAIIGAGGLTTFEEILVASNAFGPGNWQAASPFAFGNTDRALISGVYEAAA